ncbi:MAG: hypothetical protein AWT59_0310 [Candidatus Gallionella acididurans]|uniref:Uncharacterized protein n=1 Tax=Candidatus Gallionella acididurans TaxID=1796491 RepID=A0A139BXA7_9PROT|nr:MAG: hypothetical protein AWT59_0310 [Candidatus Gallionella acididurans]
MKTGRQKNQSRRQRNDSGMPQDMDGTGADSPFGRFMFLESDPTPVVLRCISWPDGDAIDKYFHPYGFRLMP